MNYWFKKIFSISSESEEKDKGYRKYCDAPWLDCDFVADAPTPEEKKAQIINEIFKDYGDNLEKMDRKEKEVFLRAIGRKIDERLSSKKADF